MLSRDGIPEDFPSALHEMIRRSIVTAGMEEFESQFGPAWAAVRIRFWALAYHDEGYRQSLKIYGDDPAPPQRWVQEDHLFAFFVNCVSLIETVCYGVNSVAWVLTRSDEFPITDNLRSVVPDRTVSRIRSVFGAEDIADVIEAVCAHETFVEALAIRNVLSHRGHPGRRFAVGPQVARRPAGWGFDLAIVPELTDVRRAWFSCVLHHVLTEVLAFLARHSNGQVRELD